MRPHRRRAIGIDTLRNIIQALTGETRRMQKSNSMLHEWLEASQRDFLELKAQLVTVQNEALIDPLTSLRNRRGFQLGVDETHAHRVPNVEVVGALHHAALHRRVERPHPGALWACAGVDGSVKSCCIVGRGSCLHEKKHILHICQPSFAAFTRVYPH